MLVYRYRDKFLLLRDTISCWLLDCVLSSCSFVFVSTWADGTGSKWCHHKKAVISGSPNNRHVLFGYLYLSPSVRVADYYQPNYLPTHEDEIAENTSAFLITRTLLYIIQDAFNVEASVTVFNRQCGGGILSSGRDMSSSRQLALAGQRRLDSVEVSRLLCTF